MSIEVQGHFFTIYFPGFVFLCFTRPRYQVSVYRSIGPLVISLCLNRKAKKMCVISDPRIVQTNNTTCAPTVDSNWRNEL